MTHITGTREEHETARAELLAREKELTRLGDDLARQRRELPWVPVDQDYAFDTHDGRKTLAELFDGQSQLLVYHFMYGPDWGDEGCVGCSFLCDHMDGSILHAQQRDLTIVVCSRAPLAKIDPYKQRMGWQFEWVSSAPSSFNEDFGATVDGQELSGLSAFALQDGVVHHTYSSWDRGMEIFDGAYHLLDRAPLGRQESPGEGLWWRRHDEYERQLA